MSGFQVKYDKDGSNLKINLTGNINEDVLFDKYPLTGFQRIDIDLGGIKGINSCGIREWIKWFSSVGTCEINFYNCPRVIIEQFNMIDSVKPKQAKIHSFFVPYYNEDLDLEKNVLYEFGKNYDEQGVRAEQEIEIDGNKLEIDIIPNKYFQFLSIKS